MDIIDKLNIQLTKIKSILVKEIEQGEYTYNYYICEDECKFLNYFELKSYLTSTTIQKTTFLEIINELCIEISDFWNNELQKIPKKHFKEDFGFAGKYKSGNSPLSFKALYIQESKIIDYNTLSGKRNFVEKYNFLDTNIKLIADKCNIIINSITAAYPETKGNDLIDNTIYNPYSHIFNDIYSYKLFGLLHENYKNSNSLLADFSFIYRKMYEDGYILAHYKPEMFKSWLSKEPYNIALDAGLKTIDRCKTNAKEIIYSNSKKLVFKDVM